MAAVQVIGLLVLSLASSALSSCDDVLKPIEDIRTVYGGWILVESTASSPLSDLFEPLASSRMEISPTSDDAVIHVKWADRLNGQCAPGSANTPLSGAKYTFMYESEVHNGEYLQTCPTCLLMTDTCRRGKSLIMFTRDGTLPPAEHEKFKKQAQCLNLHLPARTYSGEPCSVEEFPKE